MKFLHPRLLLPALASARDSARDVLCKNNLRQVGLGIQMYMDDQKDPVWFNVRLRYPQVFDHWVVPRTLADYSGDGRNPMIGGAGRMAKFFIDRGMRRGTPRELHENVITVYGGTGPWKQRLGVTDVALAHLVVLDGEGTVRWRYAGPFEAGAAAGAQEAIDTLLGAP